MRVVILFSIIALSLTALSLNAEALAVASDYLESNTLELIEGTSTIYGIRLQNPDPYEIRAKVNYDKEIMKAMDFKEEYTLPPSSSTEIKFNITVLFVDKSSYLTV